MAKISDLQAKTSVDDDDIFHLRTTGGIDNKISALNLRKAVAGQIVAVSAEATVNLSSFDTDLILNNIGSTEFITTCSNQLVSGRKLYLFNGNSGDEMWEVIVGGDTYYLAPKETLMFTSTGSAMYVFGQSPTSEDADTGTTRTYTVKRGDKHFIEATPSADATYTLVEGDDVTPLDRVTIWNNSSNKITVTDATTTYTIDAEQSVTFAFFDSDLKWASAGWETVFYDLTNTDRVLATELLRGSVEDGKKYEVMNLYLSNYYTAEVLIFDSTTNCFGPSTSGTAASRVYWNSADSRFDCENSAFYSQVRIRLWHDAM